MEGGIVERMCEVGLSSWLGLTDARGEKERGVTDAVR